VLIAGLMYYYLALPEQERREQTKLELMRKEWEKETNFTKPTAL